MHFLILKLYVLSMFSDGAGVNDRFYLFLSFSRKKIAGKIKIHF